MMMIHPVSRSVYVFLTDPRCNDKHTFMSTSDCRWRQSIEGKSRSIHDICHLVVMPTMEDEYLRSFLCEFRVRRENLGKSHLWVFASYKPLKVNVLFIYLKRLVSNQWAWWFSCRWRVSEAAPDLWWACIHFKFDIWSSTVHLPEITLDGIRGQPHVA